MTAQPYAELRETHSAVVVLLGDRAYKFKKPVDLGFLDFSTPGLRALACDREVTLNRRMAPDVYLGVGSLQQPDRPGEPVVVMRRMPEDRRLSTLVAKGAGVEAELRDLARDLAVFHASASRNPPHQDEARRDAVLRRWRESVAQIRGLDVVAPDQLDQISLLLERFLAGRATLLDERISAGLVVDGHGDLQADDVFCLPDGPRALDCLEFDDALRHVDELDDAAFLAMDLERLGAPALADVFIAAYLEFSGDPAPQGLLHHYIAYRAFVRAKVMCLRVAQGDRAAHLLVADLVELTLQHLIVGDVRLVLVGGLPGTGKSTLAGLLADRCGYVLLSSDRIRKELAGIPPETPTPASYEAGLYTPDATDATYAEMGRRAQLLLARGESVVLDASWTHGRHREAARLLALDSDATLVELRCDAAPEVAAERMRTRAQGASDANPTIAGRLSQAADDWPSATTVDTVRAPEESLSAAVAVSTAAACERRTDAGERA